MKVISTGVLVSRKTLEGIYNSAYGCNDNCLDACTCTGNCD